MTLYKLFGQSLFYAYFCDMSLLEDFQQNWNQQFESQFPTQKTHFYIAISGGVDSVVLSFLMHTLKCNCTLLHCNFHLRGAESDRDAEFVKSWAKKLDWNLHIQDFDTLQIANSTKKGIEETARELRYDWFREMAKSKSSSNPDPILVAHHANDNIETLLQKLFRGTGLAGLHGILPISDNILRPLLFAKRNEILAFANANKLQWIEDSSNTDIHYSRNFLRQDIIPQLKTYFPNWENVMLQNIQRLTESEQIYLSAIDAIKKKIVEKDTNGNWIFNIEEYDLQIAKDTIIWEIFKQFGIQSSQIQEISKLIKSKNGAKISLPNYNIVKDRKVLIISKVQDFIDYSLPQFVEKWETNDWILSFRLIKTTEEFDWKNPNRIYIDMSKLQFPLEMRHWKMGDEMQPFGMKGKKKKLSDIFIDEKYSIIEKQEQWILADSQSIIWIVSKRSSHLFQITKQTNSILEITFTSKKEKYA